MISLQEMLLVAFIALLVFGPKKLPDIARSLGNAVSEFKNGMEGKTKKKKRPKKLAG